MGKHERQRGHDFERRVARDIRERLDLDHKTVRRGNQGDGGAGVADVNVEGWLAIECKAAKRGTRVRSLAGAWTQALVSADDDNDDSSRVPVVVWRDGQHSPMAIVREAQLDEWIADIRREGSSRVPLLWRESAAAKLARAAYRKAIRAPGAKQEQYIPVGRWVHGEETLSVLTWADLLAIVAEARRVTRTEREAA